MDSGGLGPRAILVLTSLAGGEKHGYAMMQDIERFAHIKLGPGTLYGVAICLLRDYDFVAAALGKGVCFYDVVEGELVRDVWRVEPLPAEGGGVLQQC
jgi:hypothetical protein